LSQGIPVATIGWSHKYDELMDEIGLNLNKISLSKTTRETLDNVDLIIERLPITRETIMPKVSAMKKSGREAVDEVIMRIQERFEN
jgi:polysaccharide pyruvyl transferase WcaK-like protein